MLQATQGLVAFSNLGEDALDLDKKALKTLSELIAKFTPHDGKFTLPAMAGIHLVRNSHVNSVSQHAVSSPGLCIVAQGAKRVLLGKDVYEYDESRMVVYSAEVPIGVNIIKASKKEPYLCLVIPIDPKRLARLSLKVFPHGLSKGMAAQALYIGKTNPKIVTAAIRLMELVLQKEDEDLLLPLVVDEILIRLLRSPAGASIAQIGMTDSNACKIARAITWLKTNYAGTMKVEALAELAGMSASSFHQHFKAVTCMSPLQYQKQIRLQEARNLMYSQMLDVSMACMQVGYASVSQFSREYTRHFGAPPSKDIASLRQTASLRTLTEE